MFRPSTKRLRALLELAGDILGDPEDGAEPDAEVELWREHPHRRRLTLSAERRPGSVPPAPAHCLSPVRARSDHAEHDREALR